MVKPVRRTVGMGLALGLGALPLAAQSMALPAADPVGISRSGAQVAYGYSLEAAAANPALLASLKEARGAYVAFGLELSSQQQSLESNQRTYYTSDRNRSLAGFGFASRLTPRFTLGLKLDEPFLRHSQLRDDAPSRFLGDRLDLGARRLEVQGAWALSPTLSVGLGVGAARLNYEAGRVLRLVVPLDPTAAQSTANPADGLVETRASVKAHKVVPSYSLGARWALNPRWTFGFSHQSGLKGDMDLEGVFTAPVLGYYSNDGLSVAPLGTAARAATLMGLTRPVAASGTVELPSQTTFGVRHRWTPMVTWEADLRWTSASLGVPALVALQTPSGTQQAPVQLPQGRGHIALLASLEVELGKFWTVRGGLALDGRSVDDATAEPLLGGSRTSAFSIGAGYKVWGGEVSFGYQYRLSEDQDLRRLDGVWSAAGFRGTGTRSRMEGMGHLMSLGFKTSF